VYRISGLRPIRPLRTHRAQTSDPFILRTGIRMRSGAYASSRQDTDYEGLGGGQELRSLVHDGRYGLPDCGMCTQGDLKAIVYGQARRVVEITFFGYRHV
jgi:hypothetical protein